MSSDHHDIGDAAPLADALKVLMPVLGIMGGFAYVVYLLVSASVHH